MPYNKNGDWVPREQGSQEHPICPMCSENVYPKDARIDMRTETIFHQSCYEESIMLQDAITEMVKETEVEFAPTCGLCAEFVAPNEAEVHADVVYHARCVALSKQPKIIHQYAKDDPMWYDFVLNMLEWMNKHHRDGNSIRQGIHLDELQP